MTRSMYLLQASSYRAVDGLGAVGLVGDEPDGDDDGIVYDGHDIREDVSILLRHMKPTIPSSPAPFRNPRTLCRPSPLDSTPLPWPHSFSTDAPPSTYLSDSTSSSAMPLPPSSVIPLPTPIHHAPSSNSPPPILPTSALNKRQRQNLARRVDFRAAKLAKTHIENIPDARSSEQTKTSPYSGFRKYGDAPAREVIIIPMGDGYVKHCSLLFLSILITLCLHQECSRSVRCRWKIGGLPAVVP